MEARGVGCARMMKRRVRLEAEPRAATIPFSGYTSYTS